MRMLARSVAECSVAFMLLYLCWPVDVIVYAIPTRVLAYDPVPRDSSGWPLVTSPYRQEYMRRCTHQPHRVRPGGMAIYLRPLLDPLNARGLLLEWRATEDGIEVRYTDDWTFIQMPWPATLYLLDSDDRVIGAGRLPRMHEAWYTGFRPQISGTLEPGARSVRLRIVPSRRLAGLRPYWSMMRTFLNLSPSGIGGRMCYALGGMGRITPLGLRRRPDDQDVGGPRRRPGLVGPGGVPG